MLNVLAALTLGIAWHAAAAPEAAPDVSSPGPAAAETASAAVRITFEPVARVAVPEAEIVDFDAPSRTLLVTGSGGVTLLDVAADGAMRVRARLDPAALAIGAGLARDEGVSATHVAVDPRGRGFAAVAVVPDDAQQTPGRVVFVSMRDARVLAHVVTGFGPDACRFSPDGAWLATADEGEVRAREGVVTDPPGGVTLIDLRDLTADDGLAAAFALPGRVRTVGFEGAMVEAALAGRAETGLRIRPHAAANPASDLEPESLAFSPGGERLFVTLQENNALAALDPASGAWVGLRGLGVVERTIDASSRDGANAGPAANVATRVRALPMPDHVAALTLGGRLLLATADEGDSHGRRARLDEATLDDAIRLGDTGGAVRVGAEGDAAEHAGGAPGGALAMLEVVADRAGTPRAPVEAWVFGARSVSLIDALTLERVADSGSQLEEAMARQAGAWFNAGREAGSFDARSPQRGPEPEGLATGTLDGVTVVFAGLERPGALAALVVEGPAAAPSLRLAGLRVTAPEGGLAPEGLRWIAPERSPTGEGLLAAAFEGSSALVLYRVRAQR